MRRKNTVLFVVLACLAVGLVLTALFMPLVHIIGHTNGIEKTVVYDRTVNFFQYLQDCPFVWTQAADVYFNATGPIWLATSGILFSVLLSVLGTVMFVLCLWEIITARKTNLATKNNVLAKKVTYFVGWMALILGVFNVVAFIVTTLSANGYAEFYLSAEPVVVALIGLVMIILARLTNKRKVEQPTTKIKNIFGFSLVVISTIVAEFVLYIPVFKEIFIGADRLTIDSSTALAEMLVGDPAMIDLPFGVLRYLQIVVSIAVAFLLIYSVIGLIMTICGKATNWFSTHVKRWSMTLLVLETIIMALVLCQAAALHSTFWISANAGFPAEQMFSVWFYVAMFLPFLPYIFSTFISCQKKIKQSKK